MLRAYIPLIEFWEVELLATNSYAIFRSISL